MGFFDGFREQPPEQPVCFEGNAIYVDSDAFVKLWRSGNHAAPCEFQAVLRLSDAEPVIALYEDGEKTREYRLQTEGDERFDGKYFHIGVRLGFMGMPPVATAQIDGFVSDAPEPHEMTRDEIGYRMEGHFLQVSEEAPRIRYAATRGMDLVSKGLKYPGYTTPSNVRLVGICADCGKSFAFHGYAFYMAQQDVAYSDDGLDVCVISAYDIDPDTWTYEAEGKVFRYYNSFRCPHCGAPYIDYENNHGMKKFGVSGCVHLGREAIRAD